METRTEGKAGGNAGGRDLLQGSEVSSGHAVRSASREELSSEASSGEAPQRMATPPSARGIGRSVHAKGSSSSSNSGGIGSHRMMSRTDSRTAAGEVASGAGASGELTELRKGSPGTRKQPAGKANSPICSSAAATATEASVGVDAGPGVGRVGAGARLDRKSSPAWLPQMPAVDAATIGDAPGAEPQLSGAVTSTGASGAVTDGGIEDGNRRKLSGAMDACGVVHPQGSVPPAGLRARGAMAGQLKGQRHTETRTCATESPAASAAPPNAGISTTTTTSSSTNSSSVSGSGVGIGSSHASGSAVQRVPSSSRAKSMELAPRGGIRGMQARQGQRGAGAAAGGGGEVKGRVAEKRLERVESGDGEPLTPKGGKDAMELFLEKLRMAEAAEAQGLVSALPRARLSQAANLITTQD